ncbi:MAG: hypothetical protein DRR16_21175 [Candidatus Parabeggiatoa sp. nov. 3]|nr:MAG: hypothetical protein DRR16_21175 [Gammaproteobacteria bacterium]
MGGSECQKNMQEELRQILGVPRGLWNAAYREGEGLFEFGGDIHDLNYWYFDPDAAIEVVDKYFKAGGAIVDDPSLIVEGIIGPTLDAWNRGEYGEAAGEFAALLVFGILDPLKGGGKAGRVGGSINRMVPDVDVPGGSGGKGGGGKIKFVDEKLQSFEIGGRTFEASRSPIIGDQKSSHLDSPRLIDPGIPQIVRFLETKNPGLVKELELNVRISKGQTGTDLDIVTNNGFIIQVSQGQNLGKSIKRAKKAIQSTEYKDFKVVGFLEDGVDSRLLPGNPRRDPNDSRIVLNDLDELDELLNK